MYKNKRVLLIAGGGTLGTYVSEDLIKKGVFVDVICLEDHTSCSEKLTYYKEYATKEFLETLFFRRHYDGIVNFIHYKTVDEYREIHELLIKNTDHLIFLSSYRVYDDKQHPITENAPRLLDTTKDEEFLAVEDYALPKARVEDFLFGEHAGEHWTIVRPVISFSHRRFDLFVYSDDDIFGKNNDGGKLYLPEYAKNLTAGIDWAGNSGKIIANLLFKKETFGEAYTISSGKNLTWGEVANIYSELLGFTVEWCTEEKFKESYPAVETYKKWLYLYDRKFNRLIDNTKVLMATGLKKEDFASIRDGIIAELEKRGK